MTFTTPNSAGFEELDLAEAHKCPKSQKAYAKAQKSGKFQARFRKLDFGETNTESSNAYLTRKRKRKMREFNACHDGATGKFCSDKKGNAQWQRTLRGATAGKRASRMMDTLDSQMKNLAKDRPWAVYDHTTGRQSRVSRALTLRKRMDIVGPRASHHRQNSFFGSIKRVLIDKQPYRGRKR